MRGTYYNEIDPYAAAWLRNLIAAGHIADGVVDERSIADVSPDDLKGFAQCHFFAGIGGWPIALRLAGWPDDRPVWTGSCPCQPFSAAGAGKAADDSRHLWPAWFPLIAECRPPTVFGEQVEAAIGWGWLDAVFADLEGQGYACGAAVLPACGVGAPHIRQRVWFVADCESGRGRSRRRSTTLQGRPEFEREALEFDRRCDDGSMAHPNGRHPSPEGLQRGGEHGQRAEDGSTGELGDARGPRLQERERDGRIQREALEPSTGQATLGGGDASLMGDAASGSRANESVGNGPSGQHVGALVGAASGSGVRDRSAGDREAAPGNAGAFGFWSDCDWLPCTDGKARPVEPGSFPLAHGVQRRASKLRAYGNAIVPQIAAQFIGAVMP